MIRLASILLLITTSGCIFRNADAPRLYRPAAATLDDVTTPPASDSGTPIRLRPVHGTPILRERIVWRSSAVEYGVYEQRQWLELPASYVERALTTQLARTPGIRLTDDPRADVLSVEVTAFDEVLAPAYAAQIAVTVVLRDGSGRRLVDRGFTADQAAVGAGSDAFPIAMGAALDRLVADVAQAVAAAVAPTQRTSHSSPPSGRKNRANMPDR
ncbi:MAG TPA: ABC-type transport auxiliary lipoprotein family protein [Candidatus Binatia bacterium]|jgi:ABC-type uncharacterized transport system auxiliary subunit|nr:ABC-type transport auxiliary lipoprotein family protein [Candidatus Binatia bacterium]